MSYFVAGGIFSDLDGNELFSLVCPSSGGLPYVLKEAESPFFRLIWEDAHLYQIEEDGTLSLVSPSPEALQKGIRAPEKVTPEPGLVEKLQSILKVLAILVFPFIFQ
uniref:Uncharacterized protein n=1 Tax=Desulfobacca acetoxidans TaxID=60893 RepID=A0A7C3V5K3_9BACT